MSSLLVKAKLYTYDMVLAAYNLVTPNLKADAVVPQGCPGAGGHWPEYIAPQQGDSRCSCPALNALANHSERFSHFTRVWGCVPDSYTSGRSTPEGREKYDIQGTGQGCS
jgi:hypothetical protein